MKAQDLKNSILQLAIQGKLVEHRKEEGTAKELLKKIKAEKEQLIKEGKIKKEKPLPEITEDEIPFDIPESWEWVRLGNVLQIINGDRGKNYPSKDKLTDKGIPFISAVNIENQTISEEKLLYMSEGQYEKLGSGKLVLGDLVLCIRGSLGKNGRYPFETGAIASSLVILRSYVKSDVYYEFISKYINSGLFSKEVIKYNNGTAQPNLGARDLAKFIIPLPPLEEQKRIVAKIEELMPLVEKYGEAHSKLEAFNKKFPEDMQKSILQYAIQGKLVEQREEEGTAEELYQQIQAEKAKLIKEGKIKKDKPLAEITEEEIPFEIPASWKWVRLGGLFNVSTGMTPSKSNPLFHENGDIPWITSSQTGELRIEKANNFITRFAVNSTSLKIYPKHTLLIAMYGQGKTRGQISELLIDATINQACAALENIIDDESLRNYTLYFQMYNYDISRTGAEGSAQPNLNLDKIRNILVPLPPLAEQKRIVAKIEEMLPYCQQLVK